MGKKKQNKKAHQSKAAETSNPPTINESLNISTILDECKRADRVFKSGDHKKALKIAEEACLNYKNSSLVHRMNASICMRAASTNKDQSFKRKLFNNAMASAEEALRISPNSLNSAFFYIRLLLESDSYRRIIQEGQRAVEVQNPIDPAEDRWEQPKIGFPTREARIADIKEHIRVYVDECTRVLGNKSEDQISENEKAEIRNNLRIKRRLAMVDTMNEKEKLAKMPERQISEEAKLVQNQDGQSMENKNLKHVGKKEENSKPLQENFSTALVQPHEDGKGKNLKHVGKKEEKVSLLWNSMSVDEKYNLLKLNIGDLLAHFRSTKSYSAKVVISEAIEFAEGHNTWEFWKCCSCDKKFSKSDLHYQHVVEKHIGRLSKELQLVLPSAVSTKWQSMIRNGQWKPVDAHAPATLLILRQLNNKDRHTGESHQQSTPEPSNDERNGQECKGEPCWPIAQDPGREKLLKQVRTTLLWLLEKGGLAADHIEKVVQYSMKKLEVKFPDFELSKLGLDQTHICICFLDALQLGQIHLNLGKLVHFLSASYGENKSEIDKILHLYTDRISIMKRDTNERIILSDDSILVDEHSLCGKSTSEVYTDDNASATSVSDGDKRDMGPPSTDDILRWMFTGPPSKEEMKVWSDGEKLRKDHGNKLHKFLQKNSRTLETQCMKKRNQLNYKEALEAIWDLLVKELEERKFGTNYAPRSFETILQKKLEELNEDQNDVSKIMLDIVRNVLNKAQSMNFRCEPTLTAVVIDGWGLCTFEDGDLMIQSSLDNADTCIKEEIQNCGKKIDLELLKNDSLMMHTRRETDILVNKINPFAAGDYRTILVSLVKLYILANLERRLDKEATDSSKVAKEAKLAQVSPEIKKSVNEGSNQPKLQSKKGRFDKEETESSKVGKEAKLAQVSPEIKKSVNEGSNQPKSQSKKGIVNKEETDSSKVAKEAKLPQVSPEIKRSVNEGSNQSKPEEIQHLWNSMTLAEKQQLFKLKIEDLVAHFESTNTYLAKEVIPDALDFFKDHQSWKFWMCWSCDKKFADPNVYYSHVLNEHVRSLSPEQLSVLPSEINNNWHDNICNEKWEPLDASAAIVRLLEKIRQMLQNLLKAGCLVADHLDKIKQYTMQSLQGRYLDSTLSALDLSNSHLGICFLGVSQLNVILTFLKELSEFASKRITAKKNSTDMIRTYKKVPYKIEECIEIDGGFMCLVVEEQSLQGDYADSTNVLLKWTFSGKLYEDPLELWQRLKEIRDRRVKAYHLVLQENYHNLQEYCDDKCKRLGYKEAIKNIWGLLLNEVKKRRSNTEYVPHSFEAILQKKQEELEELERKVGEFSFIRKCILKAIPVIIKKAGGRNFTNEETLTEIAAINDCGLDEDEDLSVQNSLDQADTSIKEATKLVGQHIEIELMKNDTWIRNTLHDMDKLAEMIKSSSAADYHEILLPPAMSYILANLEKRFDKEATDSSEVVKEAKLAQVSPEIKKCVNEGSNQSKPLSKKKKKTKKSKNRTDSKSSGGNAQLSLDQQSGEQISEHSASSSADHPDSKSICKSGVGGDNDLKQEEEEVRHQLEMETMQSEKNIEFQRQYEKDHKQQADICKKEKEKVRHQKEMEALKDQEQLENQRQHENDDKLQKHMAELHNKVTETNPNKIDELVGGMEAMEIAGADVAWKRYVPQQWRSIIRPEMEEASQFLCDRWEAVMRAYNDPTTDESERPVMYSGNNEPEPEAEANDPDVEKEAHES